MLAFRIVQSQTINTNAHTRILMRTRKVRGNRFIGTRQTIGYIMYKPDVIISTAKTAFAFIVDNLEIFFI